MDFVLHLLNGLIPGWFGAKENYFAVDSATKKCLLC